MLLSKISILFIPLFLLTNCSKTEPSTAIIDNIKQDVKVVEKQVETVKASLPVQCKTPVIISQIDTIQASIKSISAKAESVDLACKTEKEVLTQQISKLHIIIGILFTIGCVLGFLLTKKRLLL